MTDTTIMYRPCSEAELELVAASRYKEWPQRLPDQPIFYPVTNERYAREVNAWNVRQFGKGYVTRFRVRREFVDNYEIHTVGAAHHTEWWIPAGDLAVLNENIVGDIEVIDVQEASTT